MKIAILSPWSISPNAVGGTERFVMDLGESLSNLKHEVDVYMLSGKNYSKNNVNYINMNLFNSDDVINEYILRNEFNDFSNIDSYKKLGEKVDRSINFCKYDLVQINSQLFLDVAKNTNRIFTIHTNPFEYKLDWGEKSFGCMLELMKKESNVSKTKFVTPSRYYANEYSNLTGVNIDFIPHAIDIKRLYCEKNRDEILNELNIDSSKKIILLPSRLEPIQKQPMLFMKAFALLDESIKNQYVVVCTGADKHYLKYKDDIIDFCNNNGINIKVTRFNEMSDAYRVADIVALPSQSESFGYSALESLSMGIPTVLNSIPTFKEVADGSINYFFFDNSVETLYNVLKDNIFEMKKVKQLDSWSNKYSIINFGKNYLNLLK